MLKKQQKIVISVWTSNISDPPFLGRPLWMVPNQRNQTVGDTGTVRKTRMTLSEV